MLHIDNILVEGLCGNKSVTNVASPLSHMSICICGAYLFFSDIDKIINFWQQKQKVLFLSNIAPPPKCCRVKWCCWGTHIGAIRHSNTKNDWFFELLGRKRVPVDDLGGHIFVADFRFFIFNKKRSFSFFRFVSKIFIREMNLDGHNSSYSLFDKKMTSYSKECAF